MDTAITLQGVDINISDPRKIYKYKIEIKNTFFSDHLIGNHTKK